MWLQVGPLSNIIQLSCRLALRKYGQSDDEGQFSSSVVNFASVVGACKEIVETFKHLLHPQLLALELRVPDLHKTFTSPVFYWSVICTG